MFFETKRIAHGLKHVKRYQKSTSNLINFQLHLIGKLRKYDIFEAKYFFSFFLKYDH